MRQLVFALLLGVTAFPAIAAEPAIPARLDEVAERGAKVMPFDLEKTTHALISRHMAKSQVRGPEA